MADWSYASEDLKEIKRLLSLHKFDEADLLIKQIYTGKNFEEEIKKEIVDTYISQSFIEILKLLTIKFVPQDYIEVQDHFSTGRGFVITMYSDFFIAFVSDNKDIIAMMLHEYLHHLLDKGLWNRITSPKGYRTIKEVAFMEDMYINAWMFKLSNKISARWQTILVNHDMFHGLTFTKEEEKYNSLLTEKVQECNISLNDLYDNLREENINLLEPRHFAYFVSYWNSLLRDEEEIKKMINNLKINNVEQDHETCTPCQTETE